MLLVGKYISGLSLSSNDARKGIFFLVYYFVVGAKYLLTDEAHSMDPTYKYLI